MILRFAVSDLRPKENSLAFAQAMQSTEENVREARFISVLFRSRVFEDVDTNISDWIQKRDGGSVGGIQWRPLHQILKFEYSSPGFAHSRLADFEQLPVNLRKSLRSKLGLNKVGKKLILSQVRG